MSAAASYARFIAERAQPPPRTSGVTRHWDGRDVASQGLGLPPVSDPVAYAAVPAQAQPGLERRASPPMPMRLLRLIPALPTPDIDWATEAVGLIFYLPPDLLLASRYDGVSAATGVLLWVYREGHVEGITSGVHPALRVQTASASLPGACVALVPHLPTDDPLLHHMGLVLQADIAVEGMASQLYAESLANALAVHFLRRYAACQHPARGVPRCLTPSKLQRTIAYIHAHLEHTLPLADLAAVAQTSLAHFVLLFKHAMGQTPHQYVILCR